MPPTDPRAYQNLEPGFRRQVEAWINAGGGRFWLPVGGGWRSTERQRQLYIDHCGSLNAPTSACRPPTARPGSSRHEIGQAVDITGDKAYAAQIAPQFGLTPLKNRQGRVIEDWHFQSTGDPIRLTPNGNAAVSSGGGGQNAWNVVKDDLGVPDGDDNRCVIGLPSFLNPAGAAGTVLDFIPGMGGVGQALTPATGNEPCLLRMSQVRAMFGAVCLVAGTIITGVGLILLVGKSVPVPSVGIIPGLNGQTIPPPEPPKMWVTERQVRFQDEAGTIPAHVETTRQVRRQVQPGEQTFRFT